MNQPEAETADNQNLTACFVWLDRALKATPFGEVGITLVVHEGKIIRIKKLLEESRRLAPR